MANNKTNNKEQSRAEFLSFVQKEVERNSKLLLSSLTKTTTATYEDFTKEKFRTYNKNPMSNEAKLREMSQFLARVSMPYKRLLWYYASIPLFYWNLTPQILDITKVDNDKLLEEYMSLSHKVTTMSPAVEFKNAMYFALRDGVFYGVIYESEDNFFIQKLDPSYCRPVQLDGGVWNFAFDFAYFDKNKEFLELWHPMFQTGYNNYLKDKKGMKWQILEDLQPNSSICIKADPDSDLNLPFFIGTFEAIIDLIDARTLQRNKDIIQNYKLILQKMPTFDNGETDDWKLEVETALRYFRMLADSVPENVGVALTPMETDTIDFKQDDTNSDLIANSMKNVFDDSGVSAMLFNSDKSGSIGLDASIKTDIGLAWNIVSSIERWVQKYLIAYMNKTIFKFEILKVDIFNKDKAVDAELKLANNGVPNKMKLAATTGLTPIDVVSNQILENNILNIVDNWKPLMTSFTQSNQEAGRPEADNPSDETVKSRDGDKNKDEI